MFKKLLLAVSTLIATMGFAFAQVDVNKADQAALDSVKGIGPKMSKTIVDERKKGGDFKDWTDFEKRVKGVGDKNSDSLSKAGLTVGGQSRPNAPAAKIESKGKAKMDGAAASKAEVKKEAEVKKDAKPAAAASPAPAVVAPKDAKKEVKKDEVKKEEMKK